MKKEIFNELINEILSLYKIDVKILLLQNQHATKWYDKTYTNNFDEIKENTIYGISINGIIDFDFKVGTIDNLLKKFITTFTTKYKHVDVSSTIELRYKTKEELRDEILKYNKDRIYKGLFYTTLYGIGYWCIFSTKKDNEIALQLHEYLKNNNIKYSNEYSEAGWVYRFKINKSVTEHNTLLNNFNI